MCYLYELLFPNGKRYVGISGNPKRRLKEHLRSARYGSLYPVHCAIRASGAESVILQILVKGERAYIADLEVKRIGQIASGYNATPGGEMPPAKTPEIIARISASVRRYFEDPEVRAQNRERQRIAHNTPEMLAYHAEFKRGSVHTAETRARMSEAHIGKVQSPEWIENRVSTQRGKKRSEASRARMSVGQKKRVRTDEEIARMSEICKGRVFTPEWRERLRQAALARYSKREKD